MTTQWLDSDSEVTADNCWWHKTTQPCCLQYYEQWLNHHCRHCVVMCLIIPWWKSLLCISANESGDWYNDHWLRCNMGYMYEKRDHGIPSSALFVTKWGRYLPYLAHWVTNMYRVDGAWNREPSAQIGKSLILKCLLLLHLKYDAIWEMLKGPSPFKFLALILNFVFTRLDNFKRFVCLIINMIINN